MPRINMSGKMMVYLQKTVIGVLVSVLSFFLINFYNDIKDMKKDISRMQSDMKAIKVVLYIQSGIDLDRAKKLAQPKPEDAP